MENALAPSVSISGRTTSRLAAEMGEVAPTNRHAKGGPLSDSKPVTKHAKRPTGAHQSSHEPYPCRIACCGDLKITLCWPYLAWHGFGVAGARLAGSGRRHPCFRSHGSRHRALRPIHISRGPPGADQVWPLPLFLPACISMRQRDK
jgi:hypothetical protein